MDSDRIPSQICKDPLQRRKQIWELQCKKWLETCDIREEECSQEKKTMKVYSQDSYRKGRWREKAQRKQQYDIGQFNPEGEIKV